jgi:molybdopterin synthase sulfur carrier subunit
MPIFCIPALMKYYVADENEILVSGTNISEALSDLTKRYPSIKVHILDDKGRLRRHVNLFVNKENIRTLNGLETPVKETDKIILMPSISGG